MQVMLHVQPEQEGRASFGKSTGFTFHLLHDTEQRTRCSSPRPRGVFSSPQAGQTLPSLQTCVRTRSVLCNICTQATPLLFPRSSSRSGTMGARVAQGQLEFVCTSSGPPHWHSPACILLEVMKPKGNTYHHHSSISTAPKPLCPCLSPRNTHPPPSTAKHGCCRGIKDL